jgi:large subunit ribosomal protein L4
MEAKLFDKQGKETGTVKLTATAFGEEVNRGLLWENITVLLGNKRRGCASTKSKAEVTGSGKKPYRQKGIGWARHGTIRSPIWRGGGVVFGPKPRDYYTTIPKKKRIKALRSSLNVKALDNKIMVIEDIKLDTPKTRNFDTILTSINLKGVKTLIGVEEIDKNLKLAGRNIPYVQLKRVKDINCLDVLSADYLLITKPGLKKLEQRCSGKK